MSGCDPPAGMGLERDLCPSPQFFFNFMSENGVFCAFWTGAMFFKDNAPAIKGAQPSLSLGAEKISSLKMVFFDEY